MVNLEFAKSPLGGAKCGSADKAVLIQEVAFTPGFDLRVNPDSTAFLATVAALGLVLPTTVGQVTRSNADCIVGDELPAAGGVSALCLGPDWWYLTGTADIQALLKPVQDSHHISLVDVSSQRTKIEIYGPNANAVTNGDFTSAFATSAEFAEFGQLVKNGNVFVEAQENFASNGINYSKITDVTLSLSAETLTVKIALTVGVGVTAAVPV
jgi:heterotetrameric sarcosine oxidase gamma subunit